MPWRKASTWGASQADADAKRSRRETPATRRPVCGNRATGGETRGRTADAVDGRKGRDAKVKARRLARRVLLHRGNARLVTGFRRADGGDGRAVYTGSADV